MEDGQFLSQEDKKKMESLKKELSQLKAEHKEFASRKSGLSSEDKEKWRLNSQRTNQVYIEIKDLRFKNVLEAGKG
ncbi:MAG: hypothetical protein NDI69_04780 [Bacteriovoracaceae bacterium]|nr:hypothetical protein [Bacteriovoracaceae bacterium]